MACRHPIGGNAARLALFLTLTMALAACSSDSKKTEEDPNVFPTNYKKEVLDTVVRSLSDPTNVRDAYITEPALRSAGRDQRYFVCVRFNPRDPNRRYMGSEDRIAYFYAGRLNQLVEASKEQCDKASYRPFPELEKVCMGAKCE